VRAIESGAAKMTSGDKAEGAFGSRSGGSDICGGACRRRRIGRQRHRRQCRDTTTTPRPDANSSGVLTPPRS
jgi:hypothetical protein